MASRIEATIICNDSSWTGYGYTICISHNREVYSFGKHRKCAHGHKGHVLTPTKIPSLKNITSISCGDHHTVCLDIEGNIFTFGGNMYGQLGIGIDKEELEYTHIPQKVDISPIKQISSGYNFIMCLAEDGDLYSFGSNNKGQLGLGNNQDYNTPKKIESLHNIDFLECGADYTICKTFIGCVYVWGINEEGQLGIGDAPDNHIPFKCSNWPKNIVDIKCGLKHSLLLTSDQQLYSWGSNYYGQLGRNTTYLHCPSLIQIKELSEIKRIECGKYNSICIDIYDNIYLFGYNLHGQLGLGDTSSRKEPIKHPSLSNIIDISSRGHHTLIKTQSNEIYAFGRNNFSQLGIETEDDNQFTPIRVLQSNEDIWSSFINKSKAKSARFVFNRQTEVNNNSPPKKKLKLN